MAIGNFPEYFSVKLTQDDIDKGVMGSMTRCALALAFIRECPGQTEPGCVEVDAGSLDFSEYDFVQEDGVDISTLYEFHFDLDDDVWLHQVAFDLNKKRVKPMNLCVNITDVDIDEDHDSRVVSIAGDISIHQDQEIADVIENSDYFLGQINQDWERQTA